MNALKLHFAAFAAAVFVSVAGACIAHWTGMELRFLTGWAASSTYFWMLK